MLSPRLRRPPTRPEVIELSCCSHYRHSWTFVPLALFARLPNEAVCFSRVARADVADLRELSPLAERRWSFVYRPVNREGYIHLNRPTVLLKMIMMIVTDDHVTHDGEGEYYDEYDNDDYIIMRIIRQWLDHEEDHWSDDNKRRYWVTIIVNIVTRSKVNPLSATGRVLLVPPSFF